jgi:hypothetical protein
MIFCHHPAAGGEFESKDRRKQLIHGVSSHGNLYEGGSMYSGTGGEK